MEDYIEFDKLKTKVLKYALYKKRSEAEIRRKFAEKSGEMLGDSLHASVDDSADDSAHRHIA